MRIHVMAGHRVLPSSRGRVPACLVSPLHERRCRLWRHFARIEARNDDHDLSPPKAVTEEPQPTDEPPDEEKPGFADREYVQEGESVRFWREWERPESMSELARRLVQHLTGIGNAAEAAYWGYHVLRTNLFASQAALGYLNAYRSFTRERRGQSYRRLRGSYLKALGEAIDMFGQDLRCIREGKYKFPYDMVPTHRQNNPARAATDVANLMYESSKILRRRESGELTGTWLESNLAYPDYVWNNFHFQSDGWMSSDSASRYEFATETLFVGRQDAMQRGILASLADNGPLSSCCRALEVGAGTGRFHTFFKDNYPFSHSTLVDISPFYLERARDNMDHWRRLRLKKAGPTKYVHAAAENLPSGNAQFDVAFSVYMFHELPTKAREDVAAELARVVKPGGIFVLADSVQMGDRPRQDANLDNFGSLNEPFYRTYIRHKLCDLFDRVGFDPVAKELASQTKILTFRRRSSLQE